MADLTLGDLVKYGENAQLQSHLDDLLERYKANDVLPKPTKCQVIMISFFQRYMPNPMFTLNDILLNKVNHMKFLGVTIQSDLKLDVHVADTISRSSRRVFTLFILNKYDAPLADFVLVFTCYIRPILEYSSPVWHTLMINFRFCPA